VLDGERDPVDGDRRGAEDLDDIAELGVGNGDAQRNLAAEWKPVLLNGRRP